MTDLLLTTLDIIIALGVVSISVGNLIQFNEVNRQIQDLNRNAKNLCRIEISNSERIEILEKKLEDHIKHTSQIQLQ